jgi:hypothetical protein
MVEKKIPKENFSTRFGFFGESLKIAFQLV